MKKMKYTQKKLGYGNIKITLDIYSHINRKVQKDRRSTDAEYMKDALNYFSPNKSRAIFGQLVN
ncbi:hypothetical protein A3863_24260 [Priestia endophytica]|nr:hypothetical protein A3863_24260 [Priestia endophytica]